MVLACGQFWFMETAIGAVALDRAAQPEPTSPLPIIIVRPEMRLYALGLPLRRRAYTNTC